MGAVAPVRAARFLEQALLWNLLIHTAAMLSMALILLRGLPGAGVSNAERVAFMAENPWLWRLGWLPWHLCAIINLLTCMALVATPWVPRLPAWLALTAVLCGLLPEQAGEVAWVSYGLDLARQAQTTADLGPYLAFESWASHFIMAVGASFYLLMALGWTWCFAAAGTWNRALTWLSLIAWSALAVGSVGLFLPEGVRPGPGLAATSNGIGFLALEVWLLLVLEMVLRRSRPDEAHGRLAPWRHPSRGFAGRSLDALANSRAVRLLAEWLPVPAFRSEISDVIYVNHLVEAQRLAGLVPVGLQLQRLGPDGRYALLSSLTYRHGHFGPELLGPLRHLLPSPVQSNWRTYVVDPRTGKSGIYFFTNAISSTLHALAARLLSEGMPMHALAGGAVVPNADGSFTVALDPGSGSGPDLEAHLRPGEPVLPLPWSECWPSYDDFLVYTVSQDRALSSQPWYARVTRQEIALGITADVCVPLAGEVSSRSVQAIVGEVAPLSFRVPSVRFRFAQQEYDTLEETV